VESKFNSLKMSDFNTFSLLSGVYNFSTKDHNFNLMCVCNDDASVVNHFWKGKYKNIVDLDLWADKKKQRYLNRCRFSYRTVYHSWFNVEH